MFVVIVAVIVGPGDLFLLIEALLAFPQGF